MPKRKPERSSARTEESVRKRACLEEEEPQSQEGMDDEEAEIENGDRGDTGLVREAEVGIIERISLKNFMCHGRLDVKLGPHVNFIIGRNGSGKSAVVTGLVVGLGGLASTTNRGSKVRSFVKSGKQTAEVEIHLRNRGVDAYKHQMYGDTIIVHRKISADGGTRYSLKSENGKLVSDKWEEVKKVKDFFNIQVENPVAILNQDTSRNFLHSKSPFDKYKFFLKATQLEQMKEQYDEANASKEKTIAGIQQYEKTLPALRDEVCRWEEKFKNLGTISDLREKVMTLKHEMAWAFVVEKEKAMEPVQKSLKTEEVRLPKFVQKANESKAKVEQCQEQLKTVQAQLLTVTEEAERLKPVLKEKREVLNAAKVASRNVQNDAKNIERDLRNAMSGRQQIQQRIQELQQTAQHDYEAERLKRQEKIHSVEEQLRAAESRQKTTHHEQEQFQAAVSRYKNDIYNLQRDEKAKQTEKETNERNLHTLMGAVNNRLKRFGAWVPSALASIDDLCKKGKFHKRPRGPLGACFQLRDQTWALAVEVCLRALVHTFICHDHHDEKVLEQIFRQELGNRRRPAIITCPFKDSVHDVSRFRVVRSKYPAVLDMIDCDDPVVLNALIDQRGIENIILIQESAEARHVMMNKPPANCKEAFTHDGDFMYCKPTFRYYSSDKNRVQFLTSDVEQEISHQKELVQRLAQELRDLQQQRQNLGKQITSNQREEKKCETQLMKISEAVNNFRYELNELRMVEDPVPVDITTLEEDVHTYTQQIVGLEERREEGNAVLVQKQAECRAAEEEFRSVESEMEARANSDIPLKDELNSAQMALEEAQQHRKHYQGRLKEQENHIGRLKKQITSMQKDIETDVGKASQICPERIKTHRKPTNIEREVNQINIRIRQEEETQGDPVEITRHYKETKTRYLAIQKDVKSFKKFIAALEAALVKRTSSYKQFQMLMGRRLVACFHLALATRNFRGSVKINHSLGKLDVASLESVMSRRNQAYVDFKRMIGVRIKYFFILMLSHRQYVGRMTFNHDNQSLEMWVAPTENSEGSKDLKSLSGGERSFSTVCFILSLWNAMESPFRCLDEFDVFMDLVNRRISMDMMLQMTQNQTTKQFIFLTPQDMSQLSNRVVGRPRIFQMPDPDRSQGQTTLPYHRRGQREED